MVHTTTSLLWVKKINRAIICMILQAPSAKTMISLRLTAMLPEIEMGDLLVIHDTGAHGFAMGYNYNGKLKSSEILLHEDGSFADDPSC